jgi:hypothetical protein
VSVCDLPLFGKSKVGNLGPSHKTNSESVVDLRKKENERMIRIREGRMRERKRKISRRIAKEKELIPTRMLSGFRSR